MSNNSIASSNSATATSAASASETAISRDHLLTDIRSGRRLERVVESIKHFLDIQVDKVEQTLKQCERTIEKDRLLQKRLVEFEDEKHQWNQTRMIEIERMTTAADELTKAWADLETERRRFLDSKV